TPTNFCVRRATGSPDGPPPIDARATPDASIDAPLAPDAAAAAPDAAPDAVPDAVPGTVDTVITEAPPAFTANAAAHLVFSSPTGTDGAALFFCGVDGAAATPCTSPLDVTVPEGPHNVSVVAEVAGVRDATPATAAWTVDQTPPDTTVTGTTGTVKSSDARFDFAATE